MKRSGRVVTSVLAVAVIGAGAGVAAVKQTRDEAPNEARRRAAALYRAGLEHELTLEYGRAADTYAAALVSDPHFLPPMFQLVAMFSFMAPESLLRFMEQLPGRQIDADLRRCTEDIAKAMRGRIPGPAYMTGSADARACREFERRYGSYRSPQGAPGQARRVLEKYIDVPSLSYHVAPLVTADTLTALRDLQGRDAHPLTRAVAYAMAAHYQHKRGDHKAALAAEANARMDPAWQQAGFRIRFFMSAVAHTQIFPEDGQPDEDFTRHAALVFEEGINGWRRAVEQGDQLGRAISGIHLASLLLDRGRLTEAHAQWLLLRPTIDSAGDPAIRAQAEMRLGRTYVKMGRFAEAERHLLTSRLLEDSGGSAHTHKETEHNLLHLYEALGRDSAARHAGKEFVRFASMPGLNAVRMMSARDVGRYLRMRGEFEESRRYFNRMLADIDSLGDAWIWAGEHYELNGELDLARAYYLRALSRETADAVRPLEGLVRISLMAGDTTAAIKFARQHDRRRTGSGVPESAPLLPGVLRQLRRFDAARAGLQEARKLVETTGQPAARASLTLELAELELSQHNYQHARALADSAATAARLLASADVAVRAEAIAAIAGIRAGADAAQGRAVLDRLVRESLLLGNAQLRVEIRRRRAEASVLAGNWREALGHYKAAAVVSDSMAANIALDPQQASFRAAQRAVYDDALATILANAQEPDAPAVFADWSGRRKARGFAAGFAPHAERSRTRVGRERAAVIDYVVLDSAIGVLVRSERQVRLLRLAAAPDSVRALVRRLHAGLAARVGSSIDLSRAQYPLRIAHELHRQLIAPLAPWFGDGRELVIIPDGFLFLVPFDALVTALPSAEPGSTHPLVRYLIDDYVVTEVVAGTVADPRTFATARVVAFAPRTDGPLGAESERELNEIARVMGTGTTAYRGHSATEQQLRGAAATSAILHIATHAVVNRHDPASSNLTFAASGHDDGALHSDEIAKLRFPGTLVVLSACETAAGKVLDGEGVLSLSRSFLRAGASATIATLWPVGPRSADFMAAFYPALRRGTTPAVALREAKLQMRRSGVAPFIWAPYTAIAHGTN